MDGVKTEGEERCMPGFVGEPEGMRLLVRPRPRW